MPRTLRTTGHHRGGPDTEMSAVCLGRVFVARLWRSRYGRRFACHKQGSQTGRQRTGWRFKSSMKAVAAHRARSTALGTLSVADAESVGSADRNRPTVTGVQPRGIMSRAARETNTSAKRLKELGRAAERRKYKEPCSVWKGVGLQQPTLRRRPADATSLTTVGVPPPPARAAPSGPSR